MAQKGTASYQQATSTTPFFNKMQGVGALSASAANALESRAGGRGPRGRGRISPAQAAKNRESLNSKLTFAKDFGNEFGKNLGKVALDTGKSIVKSPFRVASSLAEIPKVVRSGGARTSDPYNLPFLGEVKTYARDAQDRIKAGDGSKMKTAETILGVGGQAILDTAALGSAAQHVKNYFIDPQGKTAQGTALLNKISPKMGAKFDQLTYRPYRGAPMGWQIRAAEKFHLPFWQMNPNL